MQIIANYCKLLQFEASGKIGRGNCHGLAKGIRVFVWARNAMEASQWPYLFGRISKKSRRAKRARGPRQKPFVGLAVFVLRNKIN
jgi:hypothetical protein